MADAEVKNKAVKEDAEFKKLNENKIEKSIRNTKAFKVALNRAAKGDFDEDVSSVTNEDLLKVTERWTIRKQFNLAEGKHFYKLYKEVFYIQDPHKYYFEEVCDPTVYRRISGQKETGDKDWANAVSKETGISIVED